MSTNNFEAAAFALYLAIRYDFTLNFSAQQAINSKDCILLVLADLYFKDKNLTSEIKELKQHAKALNKNGDSNMEEYWIFVYETLSHGLLRGNWRKMKQSEVSFIKPITKVIL